MTAPVLADPYCMCGCPKTRHKGKGMCKDCGEFECDKFEVDKSRLPAPDPSAESTSAALRRVEAERDAIAAESARREETIARVVRERDDWHNVADQLQAQRDDARSSLAVARKLHGDLERGRNELQAELDLVRDTLGNTSRAYLATTTEAAADLVHTYPALYCRTCYSRYLEDTDAATNHPHDLVPVTVTITERTTA